MVTNLSQAYICIYIYIYTEIIQYFSNESNQMIFATFPNKFYSFTGAKWHPDAMIITMVIIIINNDMMTAITYIISTIFRWPLSTSA